MTESALESLRASAPGSLAIGVEVWEVFVCRIPDDYDVELYDMSGLRFEESSQWLVEQIAPVSDYFRRWSNDRYQVEFRAASKDVAPTFSGSLDCAESALARVSDDVDGILVVADAQHRENRGGGWGRDGGHCSSDCSFPSPAKDTIRIAYVGAADFVSDAKTPLDLVEHEMGHGLDWPHSRLAVDYDSVIDVMSDSSAARRADSTRVHAPGPLAINRYLAGWMPQDPIAVGALAALRGAEFVLDSDGLALIFVSPTRAISVEVVSGAADNAHLENSGVAVHAIDWGPDVCSAPRFVESLSEDFCGGANRSHRLIASASDRTSSTDGLLRQGDRVEIDGLAIVVDSLTSRGGDIGASIRTEAM